MKTIKIFNKPEPNGFWSFLLFLTPVFLFAFLSCNSANPEARTKDISKKDSVYEPSAEEGLILGAERTEIYFEKLRDRKVAVVANQSSMIGNEHLVDSLLSSGIDVKKIFCPEHGFRGIADAGEKIDNDRDDMTGLPVISLYGNNKKPSASDLKDVDIVVFDIQDVGARFYTYISTMHYVMEACAENGIDFMVLDRPNPNGFYVDGPVLEPSQKSFVGMHQVPIVHGMTVGEYALMINGEGWLNNNIKCNVEVIPCKNYNHKMHYSLPVRPSPNLPNDRSIELYPSLCLFEGTSFSVGRGTNMQFQVIGHPALKGVKGYDFSFTPEPNEGAKSPLHKGELCYGIDFGKEDSISQLRIDILINAYKVFPDKQKFFLKNNMFNLLAGNSELKKQIIEGKTESEIRKTWQKGLSEFKEKRKLYLLYDDFE